MAITHEEKKPGVKTQIRWLIRKDMAEVLGIERDSFEFSWTEEDFLCCLRQRNCLGMVSEHDDNMNGFMVYELHKSRLHVLNFAVHSEYRGQQVGKQMVDNLKGKLYQQRRKEISLEVREGNLSAQLFFQKQGFRAVSVMRNFYVDTNEDAYFMKFRIGDADDAFQYTPINRIS